MTSIYDRYNNDSMFRVMVDTLVNAIERGQLTPTEAREAAMLAQIMFEDRNPRPVTFTKEDVVRRKV